jgi:hypothetical protein
LAATAEFASPEDLSEDALGRLDAHKSHYTMHREHEAHAVVLSGPEAGGGAKPAVEVELFGEPAESAGPPPASPEGAGGEAAHAGVELF